MKLLLVFFLAFIMLSCYKEKTFTFKYSIETFSNLKTTLIFNKADSTFNLEELNFYFDNIEGKKKPVYRSIKLSKEDYSLILEKIENSRLFGMKDSYGMSEVNNVSDKIILQLFYVSERREKYITIRLSNNNSFSKEFIDLISYCNQKITEIKQHEPQL
jgi:hypothetical protein